MVLDMLDCWFFFFLADFFAGLFLFLCFSRSRVLAVANNGGGVGGDSLVRL